MRRIFDIKLSTYSVLMVSPLSNSI